MKRRFGAERRRALRLLGLVAGGLVAAPAAVFDGSARAEGQRAVRIALLDLGSIPENRVSGLEALVQEVIRNSSVALSANISRVSPSSPSLFEYPFVILVGDQGFPAVDRAIVDNLRLYVRGGGTLFVDDSSGLEDSAFDRSVRRLLARLLPGQRLRPLGREHALYRSFFILRRVAGRLVVKDHLSGVWTGDITPVIYSQNDLFGALARTRAGDWRFDVVPGGTRQRTEARKLGVNLLLFALTGNYKLDAVHVDTLLNRMRRQGGYGR